MLKIFVFFYLSLYVENYAKTESLTNLFNKNKIKIIKCQVNGKLKYFKALLKIISERKKYDIIFLAFRGQEFLPILRIFSRKPIIFDALVSVYDTLCFDRKIFRPESIIGKFLKWYDYFLCKISDYIILDTRTHKDYFIKEFSVPKNKISYIYVGCNKSIFKPIKIEKNNAYFEVLWYGEGLPVQGVDVILKAAKYLEKNKDIFFYLIGPIEKKYHKLINRLRLSNVRFKDRVPYNDLPKEIAKANLCLGGHFSNLSKAKRVISIKTFEFSACDKAIVLGDNQANKEIFKIDKKTIFCKMNDEKALAEAILLFKNNLSKK